MNPLRVSASLLAAMVACAAPTQDGARWLDDSGLRGPRFGSCKLAAKDGTSLDVRTYRSTQFDAASGPIWFVMHGANRDVDRYIRAAAPAAERHDALAIALHFSREAFPNSSDYTLGLGRPGRWLTPENTLYAVVEQAFDAAVASLGGRQTGYHLFGHSAGAQFTHRLLTFLPQPRVLGAVAANAGWYTLPVADDRRDHAMPYGLLGAPVAPDSMRRFFATPFVVLLGEEDTADADTDPLVRGSPEARAQGATRLDRGRHYFAVAEARAKALGVTFAWRLATVPRAGHDAAQMIPSAAYLTFAPGAHARVPTRAAAASGIVITEILADPPDGPDGDVNGDGERDPVGDEFVEIANRGATPVYLAGWTLGDARSPDRHVFPLGPPLLPGQTLVVFGGGVPTGKFGGALVQWTRSGLSLSNDGDVLTLRDAEGALAAQVSWGDSDGQPRAADHWPRALGIGGSLVRAAARPSRWAPHAEAEGRLCSPGVDTTVRR